VVHPLQTLHPLAKASRHRETRTVMMPFCGAPPVSLESTRVVDVAGSGQTDSTLLGVRLAYPLEITPGDINRKLGYA
jgi:hypothetical protein